MIPHNSEKKIIKRAFVQIPPKTPKKLRNQAEKKQTINKFIPLKNHNIIITTPNKALINPISLNWNT